MSGIMAIAAGIGAQETANLYAQISTALQAIAIAPSIVALNQEYLKQIAEDTRNYAIAMRMSQLPTDDWDPDGDPLKGTGPHMAAVAAQYNIKKELHQKESDVNLGSLNNIVDTVKSNAAHLGSNLNDVYKLLNPTIQLQALILTLMMGIK
jgi:hypothetical protein